MRKKPSAKKVAAKKSKPRAAKPAARGRALAASSRIVKAAQLDSDRAVAALRVPLAEIEVGNRYRKDFGDLAALAGSINARGGLIHPVAVTPKPHRLIAGERRMRAWKLSKFAKEPIPVHVFDIDSILAGEWDENAPGIRKDFTLSEAVAIKLAIEPKERERAAERMRAGKRAADLDDRAKGNASDKVATLVGMDRKTLDKAEAVVEAARQDPEKFGPLLEQMDRTGRAHGPFKRLQNIRQGDLMRKEPSPLPGKGPYRVGVIDLPWASEPDGASPAETGRGYYNYPTMNTPEMIEFGDKVVPLLHPGGGHFWFWTTNFHLLEGHAFEVLDAWSAKAEAAGLGPIKRIGKRTWVKDRMGRGQVFRGQTEDVILCKFGKSPPALAHVLSTRLDGQVRRDSEKPEQFYRDVELATPAPRYFELFARRVMPDNWDGFGDQVGTLGAEPAAQADAPGEPAAKPKRARRKKAEGPAPAAPSDAEDRDSPPVLPTPPYVPSQTMLFDAAPAEPTLPGIAPPAPVENPSLPEPAAAADRALDLAQDEKIIPNEAEVAAERPLDRRRRLDAKVTAQPHSDVRINSHGALYEAFDLISLDTGAGNGYARYPVPRAWSEGLEVINAALAGLEPEELRALAIGTQTEAVTIAARSAELVRAQALLCAFARGWWKDDDDQPPADDLEGIPAFLRRTATNKSKAAA